MSHHAPGTPVEDQDELDAVPIEDNGEPLVDFLTFSPRIVFAPNHPVFEYPRVHLLRESVARMLGQAADHLPGGHLLFIVEGYRPIAVQKMMFAHSLEESRKRYPTADEATILREAGRFSAPPDAKTPPPHLTGGAVDLGIVTESGEMLDFSSPYEMTDVRGAHMEVEGLSPEALKNRALLREVLEPTGLTNYADEWWHWSYGDNGWALRVGAPCAIYDKVELPPNVDWVGNRDNLPEWWHD